MIEVGINGYGTIGKRVADAIAAQPDMAVAGVAKRTPNYDAKAAHDRDMAVYAADEDRLDAFEAADIPVAGSVDALIEASDVVVDATPSGIGAKYAERYATAGTPAIFQGGEDAEVASVSFTACANYDAAVNAESVRVVSCNTTGLVRLIHQLDPFGVERVRVTLVRRGGDPAQTSRGPINDILPNPVTLPSHHGPDVKTIFPNLDIDTLGLKVPATLMHVHAVNVELESAPSADEVRERLATSPRLFLIPQALGIDGAGKLKDFALDAGRPRGDLWENCIWSESISVVGNDLYLFQAIHQESDVVPENIDAIRAVTGSTSGEESRAITNEALGIGL